MDIVAMYESGMSAPKIAEKVGVSSTTIYNRLDDAGVDRRAQKDAQHTVEIENLKEMYESGMTCQEIADKEGCNRQTVHNKLVEQGIDTRRTGPQVNNYATYRTMHHGYEVWRNHTSNGEEVVLVHRLVAVAEFGFDAVKDMVVHHKNNCSWDNRPDNLELLSKSEHTAMHRSKTYKPASPNTVMAENNTTGQSSKKGE